MLLEARPRVYNAEAEAESEYLPREQDWRGLGDGVLAVGQPQQIDKGRAPQGAHVERVQKRATRGRPLLPLRARSNPLACAPNVGVARPAERQGTLVAERIMTSTQASASKDVRGKWRWWTVD